MGKLTSSEAAERLGVTSQRVSQLISAGQLSADRFGKQWMIDEESVEEYKKSKRGKGRPRLGNARHEMRFTLMNRTFPLCELIWDRDRVAFTHVGATLDEDRAPLGILVGSRRSKVASFNAWWRGRGIPGTRLHIQRVLDDAQVDLPEELVTRNLGLSLSDQYWICPDGSGLDWQDINFFNNDFAKASFATEPFSPVTTPAEAHPDNTSDGNLDKRWVVRDGVRILQKEGGRLNQEPYNELVATALHRRLLAPGEYVPYTLEGTGLDVWSACADFLTDEEEYIPALYVDRVLPERSDQNDYQHYVACCKDLGVVDIELALWKMIVCDDIMANGDRHYRNFGLVRNVNTLAYRPAPIFDSGASLWCDLALEELKYGEFSFRSKQFYPSPAHQLLLVEDMSWFEEEDLEGFVDEAVGILSQNALLQDRIPFIRRSLERRVDRMVGIREWA